jgi:hypothetical protein
MYFMKYVTVTIAAYLMMSVSLAGDLKNLYMALPNGSPGFCGAIKNPDLANFCMALPTGSPGFCGAIKN